MSFINILKRIGGVALGIEQVASPLLAIAVPGAGPALAMVDGIVQRVLNTIATVEANNPIAGNGQLKSAAVIADFQASIDLAQNIANLQGKTLQYDVPALQKAIDA